MLDPKYPSAVIKMTHDCDLTDRHFGTVTVTFSKRGRRKMACSVKNEILADGGKKNCSLIQISKGLSGNHLGWGGGALNLMLTLQ